MGRVRVGTIVVCAALGAGALLASACDGKPRLPAAGSGTSPNDSGGTSAIGSGSVRAPLGTSSMSSQDSVPPSGTASGGAADSAAPRSIGAATMEADGTLVLMLRAEGPGRMIGDAQFRYPPSHPKYKQMLEHLGGMKPGESKPVPPWPEEK